MAPPTTARPGTRAGPASGARRARRPAGPGAGGRWTPGARGPRGCSAEGGVDDGLGGAVEAVEPRRRRREEPLLQRARERLSAARDEAQGGAVAAGHVVEQHRELGRHNLDHRHAVLVDQADNPRRIPQEIELAAQHDGAAEHERPEDLPGRDVEARRRRLERPVRGAEPELVAPPERVAGDSRVADEDAPRPAGRPRGEHQVRRVAGGAGGRGPPLVGVGPRRLVNRPVDASIDASIDTRRAPRPAARARVPGSTATATTCACSTIHASRSGGCP